MKAFAPCATRATLRLLAVTVILPSLACEGLLGPRQPAAASEVEIILDGAVSEEVTFRGVGIVARLRNGAAINEARVWVDSAAGVPPAQVATRSFHMGTHFLTAVHADPGDRRITVSLVAVDGRVYSGSRTVSFQADEAQYRVTVLPDLGGDAGAEWIHSDGSVAGWAVDGTGRQRPAVWREGNLFEVPADDGRAVRINAAGDVLLEIEGSKPQAWSVDRPPAVLELLGRVEQGGERRPWCCIAAADLNENRLALGTVPHLGPSPGNNSLLVSVATGGKVDSSDYVLTQLNAGGQMAGYEVTGQLYVSHRLRTVGFPTPAPLADDVPRNRAWICDGDSRRYVRYEPTDLDDAGNLITSSCGAYTWHPIGGPGAYVDRHLGNAVEVRLSQQGHLIAGRDPESATLYVWNVASGRTARVRLTEDRWRIVALAHLNRFGVIAATGEDRATGKRFALTLTPVS